MSFDNKAGTVHLSFTILWLRAEHIFNIQEFQNDPLVKIWLLNSIFRKVIKPHFGKSADMAGNYFPFLFWLVALPNSLTSF